MDAAFSSSDPVSPRPRRRDQEVIDAAAKIFSARGYADASVQDIADELGILKGSLYHYIDTKEDLLFRLLEQVHEDVEAIMLEVATRHDLDALARIVLYVKRMVEYSIQHVMKISVYHHDVDRLTDTRRKVIFDHRKEHESFLTDLILEAQRAGQADPTLDAGILTNCIFGTVIWVYRWYRPAVNSAHVELPELCGRFVMAGVVGSGNAQIPSG
jgi:TetR/AcrR family transcriptional regulator, cholesterol catabolism regulator